MDLSRRDALRPCQGTHQAAKANFVLLAKDNCNANRPHLPFLYGSQCTVATSKHFANNRSPSRSTQTFKFCH